MATIPSRPHQQLLVAVLEEFKNDLSRRDREDFKTTTLEDLRSSIVDLQTEQHSQRRMQDMNRLKRFFEAIEQFEEVVKEVCNRSDIIAFVWGSIRRLLQISSAETQPFGQLLDTYKHMGENLPLLSQYRSLFGNEPHMVQILKLIYEDILKFHRIALRYFQQPEWENLFDTTWETCKSRLSEIISRLGRHQTLIESKGSRSQIEEFQKQRQLEIHQREKELDSEQLSRLQVVYSWLKATDVHTDQFYFSKIRSEYAGSGRWLLDHPSFKEWFDPQFPTIPPILWLNGIPGAGKTILASLVVEEARKLPTKPAVLFFYCKYNNSERDNFVALARSLLAQLLKHDRGLLPYFYQRCWDSGEPLLSSPSLVEDLLKLAFSNCPCAYIILDGLDECPRGERKEITQWFRKLVEDLPSSKPERLRCLFVSQDDGVARKDFSGLASIKISTEDNKTDIEEYSRIQADKLKHHFQLSDQKASAIAGTVTSSVGGMFLLAKLIWLNLLGQTSIRGLEEELEENTFPKEIKDAYRRIMHRIKKQASRAGLHDTLMLLGWLVCAKRSLKWHEIQGLKSINLDELAVEYERQRFRVAPKDLCDSMVEVRSDGTLELVHQTVIFFLIDDKHIDPYAEELKLACLCIDYLNLPAFVYAPTEDGVMSGDYVFMDYAILHWIRHLESGVMHADSHQQLMDQLAESLGVFIHHHWTSPSTVLKVSNRNRDRLQFFKSLPFYEKLEQAIVSSRKQLIFFGKMRDDEIALNLGDIVVNVRTVLERIVSSTIDDSVREGIQEKYGSNLFKCHRFSCQSFTAGFSSPNERNKHNDKHDLPFRCTHEACTGFIFGFAQATELERHMKEMHATAALQDQEFPTDQDVEHSMEKRREKVQTAAELEEPWESEPDSEPAKMPSKKRKRQTSFKCQHCPNSFKKRSNLQSHLLTHTSERAYLCGICGNDFARKCDYKRHMYTHTGHRSHICGGKLKNGNTWGCGKSFARADTLNNHYKSNVGQACRLPWLQEQDLGQEQIPSTQEHRAEGVVVDILGRSR